MTQQSEDRKMNLRWSSKYSEFKSPGIEDKSVAYPNGDGGIREYEWMR